MLVKIGATVRRVVDRLNGDPRIPVVRGAAVRFGAPAISVLVLVAALVALRSIDYHRIVALVPHAPLFWVVFVATYAVPIVVDWLVYRRIWGMPVGGVAPLARKLISNELVLGYLGDAYLYAWARRNGVVGPGGYRSMKDVAILSGAASNSATLLAAVAAAPFVGMLGLHLPLWLVVAGAGVILFPAVMAFAFRGVLFGLPQRDLLAIAALHATRAIVAAAMLALLWHLALPSVALVWWLLFAAVKLVLSRLPFMSNKDLLLAGVAVMLLGRHADVAALMTMIATLMTAAHVLLGIALSARDAIDGATARLQRGEPAYEPLPVNS